jgi:hypothetical protein
MKAKTFSLETTLGQLEVTMKVVPWWFTVLTFGIFRKAVCTVDGPAYARYEELCQQWGKRFGSVPVQRNLARQTTFRTVWLRVHFWHKHMKEYAKAMGECIQDHHQILQLYCRLDDALTSGDSEKVERIKQEIRREERRQDRRWGVS